MYPARSSAKSDVGGALWFFAAGNEVRSTQWATLVYLFQLKAKGALGSTYWSGFPKDGNCAGSFWAMLSGQRLVTTPANTWFVDGATIVPNGVFDLKTAAALGAVMCSIYGSDDIRTRRLAMDILARRVSRETIQDLAYVTLFAVEQDSGIAGDVDGAVWLTPSDLTADNLGIPADIELPDFEQPNGVSVADQQWIGVSARGSSAPLAPSARIAMAAGAADPRVAAAANPSPLAFPDVQKPSALSGKALVYGSLGFAGLAAGVGWWLWGRK